MRCAPPRTAHSSFTSPPCVTKIAPPLCARLFKPSLYFRAPRFNRTWGGSSSSPFVAALPQRPTAPSWARHPDRVATQYICFKGTVSRDFLLLFFYESVSPQPQSIPLGPFRIFSKIRGDIRSSRLTTGVTDTGGKWKKSSIRKILIILLEHLWIVELTYI